MPSIEYNAAVAIEVVQGALRRLDKPESWLQGILSRAADGRSVSPYHDAASCYCLMGALLASASMSSVKDRHSAHDITAMVIPQVVIAGNIAADPSHPTSWDLEKWNDTRGRKHDEVLLLLRKSLARMESVCIV